MAANIYQSSKSKRSETWVLEYAPTGGKQIDPLMGWTGSADTQSQVKLTFKSLEEARAYAAKNGIAVRVRQTPAKTLKIQSYADNFR